MITVENSEYKDLFVIVADANMQAGVNAILKRPEALGIRQITFEIVRHPWKDSGCRAYGVQFSKSYIGQFVHCLLMFDFKGCGQENIPAIELERQIDAQLDSAGWGSNAKSIVIEPELEIWVWSDSPHVENTLGWQNRIPSLREYLCEKGYLQSNDIKPSQPKEAVESALKAVRIPRSSAIYQSIAEKVSLQRCQDEAFDRFKSTLSNWFSVDNNQDYSSETH